MNILKSAKRYFKMRSSWVGEGLDPVVPERANSRAAICENCPRHERRPFYEVLTAIACAEIQSQLSVKRQMNLKVENEDKLHICGVCSCYLPLKVWVPIQHIEVSTEPGTEFAPGCWIPKEIANTSINRPSINRP